MKTITVNIKHEDRTILERKVEDYFRGYHPFGYGTRLDKPATMMKNSNVGWL